MLRRGRQGLVKCDEIGKWVGNFGERMEEHEIDKLLKGPFTRNGQFNYREWVKVLRINTDAEEPESYGCMRIGRCMIYLYLP
ncbi:hypothetical protein C8Q74DRAFT_1401820 [Fomes fomentarius]|nr:hypothetical protein C8Q74DRAFT_1401820 [Fomes fomentarius]